MSAKTCLANIARGMRAFWCGHDAATAERSESGAALVEFTVLMPVFFLVLFGIIEFGSMIWAQNTMTTAAREGARAAAVQGGDLSSAQQKACQMLARSSAGETYSVAATDQQFVGTTTYCEVTVNITVSKASASLFNTFFSASNGGVNASSWGGNLAGGATMRRESTCPPLLPAVSACNCSTAGGSPSGC